MRSKFMAVAALLAVFAVAAPACGGDDEEPASASSDQRETATTADSGDSGSEGDGGDTSVPDLSDLGNMGECLEIAGTWANIALAALGGPEDAERAREQAEDLKSSLPEDLHDDIDTVADGFATVAEEGIMNSEALESPEFEKANDAIDQYLTETCGGG